MLAELVELLSAMVEIDIGSHTKVDEVYATWDEILDKEDFLLRPRMTEFIIIKKFDYPLHVPNAP